MDSKDLVTSFSLFDRHQNGIISLEEFADILSLTDFELDLAIEKIRVILLKGCSNPNDASAAPMLNKSSSTGPLGGLTSSMGGSALIGRSSAGVLGSGIVGSKNLIGKNIIRENYCLIEIFNLVNTKDDMIFSLDEMMDMATKVEVFLSEEEARKVIKMLDIDGDDRVEEADFITFMRQGSHAMIKKGFRVREAAATLRRWLVRGTTENNNATSTASASAAQWKAFQKSYQKLTKRKFPGYLDAQVLLLTLSNLGTRLSALEARELTLLVAPEKNGRVHQADLHSFMGRENRSFGELIALLERELLKDLIDSYRSYHAAFVSTGVEDADLLGMYTKKVAELRKAVELVYLRAPANDGGENTRGEGSRSRDEQDMDEEYYNTRAQAQAQDSRSKRTNMEVISIAQLKDGLESHFK
jgi:Ca2+-binding EF-hand superfamily protein